ncbi:hypothetical protein HAZT_HAZT006774 [Hyalella azteca]|uniref:Uncharacterized protein n=1 Tax=Hyalella azteca TaxID=294128 RepID=A0A6A0GWT2_HYAAZ|nr:hypothetical protein HAZT_HAZT006774 [Hyalella azteca]
MEVEEGRARRPPADGGCVLLCLLTVAAAADTSAHWTSVSIIVAPIKTINSPHVSPDAPRSRRVWQGEGVGTQGWTLPYV